MLNIGAVSTVLTDPVCKRITKLYKNANNNYDTFRNYIRNLYDEKPEEFKR